MKNESTILSIGQLQDLCNAGLMGSRDYQRPIDDKRCDILKDWIIENYKRPWFYMPVIILNKVGERYWIIDGQHRIRAVIKIIGEQRSAMTGFGLRIDVTYDLSFEDEKLRFISINKSIPCPKLYLQKNTERKILDDLSLIIYSEFTNYISESWKCNCPNINVEKIIDFISDERVNGTSAVSDWFSDQKVTSGADLAAGLIIFNEYAREVFKSKNGFTAYKHNCPRRHDKDDAGKFEEKLRKAAAKARTRRICYLGLVSTDRIVHCMFNHGKFF
jgi:hypothetical protein